MRLGVPFALAIALLAPAAVAGEAESETVELEYRVPSGCADEKAFVAAVTARASRVRFVARASDARRFVVDVRRAGERYIGRFVVEHGKNRAVREVTAPRCEAVVDAFVLFAAIAVDATAGTEPEPALPPSASPDAEPPRASPATPPRPRPAAAARPTPAPSGSWQLAAGSGAFVATGIADSAMVAAHPVVDLAWSGTGLSPSVRLGLAWANGASQSTVPGDLTLGLRALVLSGCGVHVRVLESASVRVCATVEGGVLAVRPFAIAQPTSPDRPWFAVGPLLRLQVPILPRLAVGADAALVLPFEREEVYVRPGPTVAVVPPLGLRFAVVVLLQAF